MKLQTKPEPWLCIATAFAMALGLPVADMLRELGHDGSQIVFPDLPEPARRASHHINECVTVCLRLGYTATPVELHPITRSAGSHPQYHLLGDTDEQWNVFLRHLNDSAGVLEGFVRRWGHAMAYSFGHIYDPDGGDFKFIRAGFDDRNFLPYRAWRIERSHTR